MRNCRGTFKPERTAGEDLCNSSCFLRLALHSFAIAFSGILPAGRSRTATRSGGTLQRVARAQMQQASKMQARDKVASELSCKAALAVGTKGFEPLLVPAEQWPAT